VLLTRGHPTVIYPESALTFRLVSSLRLRPIALRRHSAMSKRGINGNVASATQAMRRIRPRVWQVPSPRRLCLTTTVRPIIPTILTIRTMWTLDSPCTSAALPRLLRWLCLPRLPPVNYALHGMVPRRAALLTGSAAFVFNAAYGPSIRPAAQVASRISSSEEVR